MTECRFALAKPNKPQPHAGQMAIDLARASPAKTTLIRVGTPAAGALMIGSARRSRRTLNL